MFRHDRNHHGGGVLVYVKTQLAHDTSIVPLPLAIDNLEFLPMSLTFCNHKFCIATFFVLLAVLPYILIVFILCFNN